MFNGPSHKEQNTLRFSPSIGTTLAPFFPTVISLILLLPPTSKVVSYNQLMVDIQDAYFTTTLTP